MTLEEPRNIPSLDAPDLETTITRNRFLSKALDKNNGKITYIGTTYPGAYGENSKVWPISEAFLAQGTDKFQIDVPIPEENGIEGLRIARVEDDYIITHPDAEFMDNFQDCDKLLESDKS